MVGMGDIEALLGVSGDPLLDAVADLVGKPRPTDAARPLLEATPVDLGTAAANWQTAAQDLQVSSIAFNDAFAQVTAVWMDGSSAQAFNSYGQKLQDVIQNQQEMMNSFPGILNGLESSIQAGQYALYTAMATAAAVLLAAVTTSWADVGACLALAPETFGASLAEIAIVIGWFISYAGAVIGALIAFIVATATWVLTDMNAAKGAMSQIEGAVSADALASATLPPPPQLDGQSFGSIDVPPGLTWH